MVGTVQHKPIEDLRARWNANYPHTMATSAVCNTGYSIALKLSRCAREVVWSSKRESVL